MSIDAPTGPVHAPVWTAHRLRSATEDVRVRVIASVLALRCGASAAPDDLDDICADLATIVRELDDTGADQVHPHDAPTIREASVAVQTAHDLVAGLLRDLEAG